MEAVKITMVARAGGEGGVSWQGTEDFRAVRLLQ
jgi:hypothetical protein